MSESTKRKINKSTVQIQVHLFIQYKIRSGVCTMNKNVLVVLFFYLLYFVLQPPRLGCYCYRCECHNMNVTPNDGHQPRPLFYAFGDAAMASSWLGWGVSPLPPPEGGLVGVELRRSIRLDEIRGDDNRMDPRSSTDDNSEVSEKPRKSSFA